MTSGSSPAAGDFTAVERAVADLTTALLTTRQATAGAVAEVCTALGAAATIEVLIVINRWAGPALMLNALEVDLDETARLAIPSAGAPSP